MMISLLMLSTIKSDDVAITMLPSSQWQDWQEYLLDTSQDMLEENGMAMDIPFQQSIFRHGEK